MSKKQLAAKTEPVEWQIDSDIPIPPRAKGSRVSKYPWDQLKAPKGDKFDSFSFTSDDSVKTARQFTSTCYTAGKRLGKKFTVRAEFDDDGNPTGVVRVWRKE